MASKPHTIIVGSYTNAIYTLEFTAEPTPTLKLSQSLDVGHHPSWLSVLPSEATKGEHTTVVLTGLEQSDGQVVAIGFDSKGNGTVLSQVSSAGRDPASLRVHPSGKEVVVGNVRVTCFILDHSLFGSKGVLT
jgi:6-phosphogluconolactonase (cycloisomerase 2 family)